MVIYSFFIIFKVIYNTYLVYFAIKKMESMYNSLRVAYFFIIQGITENNPVNPMKLQKLIYFAHGWHLALYGNPLISDEVQAWRYGPVIPSVYHSFKMYGNNTINQVNPVVVNNMELLDERTTDLLFTIWNTFKFHSAITLSNLTHIDNSPWDVVISQNNGIVDNNLPIDNNIIREYFLRTYQAQPQ